jgi:hypothetical protein
MSVNSVLCERLENDERGTECVNVMPEVNQARSIGLQLVAASKQQNSKPIAFLAADNSQTVEIDQHVSA